MNKDIFVRATRADRENAEIVDMFSIEELDNWSATNDVMDYYFDVYTPYGRITFETLPDKDSLFLSLVVEMEIEKDKIDKRYKELH